MTAIPAPPVRDDDPSILAVTSPQLAAAIAGGVYGRCVMCQHAGTAWLDLSVLGLAPVVDNTGTLTDQVPLHPLCVGALTAWWVSLVEDPGGDEPRISPADDEVGGTGGRDGGDSAARDRPLRASRLALLGGVYGR